MAAEGQLSPAEPETKETIALSNEAKSSVDIGAQHPRWIELKEDLQCGDDTLAKLLLDIWYEFKDEEAAVIGGKRNIKSEKNQVPGVKLESSRTPQSGNSSLQDSHDGLDSSTGSAYGELNGTGLDGTGAGGKRRDSGNREQQRGSNTNSSRRKQPKSRVSRYLEDEEDEDDLTEEEGSQIAETTLEDYEAGRLNLKEEESELIESQESFEEEDKSNIGLKQENDEEEDEEEDEELDEENDFLSEEELEKLLKGSESESDTKVLKRKRDSDSDWMPSAGSDKPKRRRSQRISKQLNGKTATGRGRRSSKRRVSTSAESSEVEEVIEEKPAKNPRGRPRKTRKEPLEDKVKSNQRPQKPKVMKKSGVFTCTVCGEKFSNRTEAKEHLETHYTVDCTLCTQRFYSLQTLAHHQSKKHPPNHKCNHCFYMGRTRLELKRHMRKEHLEAEAVPGTTLCHICGQQFRFVVNVQKHLMDTHGIMESNMKTYMCDQCGNEYFLKHSLRKHMLTHKDKNIVCDFEGCCSKFSSDAQYKRHYNTVHLKIKRHACPYDDCDMKFAFRKTLATHVNMVHLKLRLFPCSWQGCERSFYAKKHLTVHLRIHNDEKPFKCQECDYRCRQRAALNWHLKKHGIVPEHPESLENEKRNKKEGFPVNFKRGRKRTRFRKAKSLDYTDDQIASINQKYNEMLSDVDQQMYRLKNLPPVNADGSVEPSVEGSLDGSDKTSPDGRESIGHQRDAASVEDFKYLDRRDQVPRPVNDLAQGYARRELQSPAQDTFSSELLKREVEYPRLDYEVQKQAVRLGDFHTVREPDFQPQRELEYHVRDSNFQQSRDNSLQTLRDSGFPSGREGGYVSNRDSGYQQIREENFHPVRETPTEYPGFQMKENLDTDRSGFPRFLSKDVFSSTLHRESNFSPRLPIKESYLTGHPEIDYSRFPPKNELAALRTLPGFQGQMDVTAEYDPRSPVHAVMGGNSASYSQDLQMYSREYK